MSFDEGQNRDSDSGLMNRAKEALGNFMGGDRQNEDAWTDTPGHDRSTAGTAEAGGGLGESFRHGEEDGGVVQGGSDVSNESSWSGGGGAGTVRSAYDRTTDPGSFGGSEGTGDVGPFGGTAGTREPSSYGDANSSLSEEATGDRERS